MHPTQQRQSYPHQLTQNSMAAGTPAATASRPEQSAGPCATLLLQQQLTSKQHALLLQLPFLQRFL
jgi:hypothetical protein